MSWYSFTDLAKNALNEAQKKIDKALDIQGKEETANSGQKESGIHINTKAKFDRAQPNASITQEHSPKKAGFISKSKARHAGSTSVQRITEDASDDFFSVLNNQSLDAKPKKKNVRRFSNSQKEVARSKGDTREILKSSHSKTLKKNETAQSADTTYTEVSLVVAEQTDTSFTDMSEAAQTMDANQQADTTPPEVSDMTGKNVFLSMSAGPFLESNESFAQLEDAPNLDSPTDGSKLDDPSAISSSAAEDACVERTASPSSTVASSEIDILDHDSSVSEVSSHYNEGTHVSSPSHVGHINAVGADVSQVPVLIDSTRSSPHTITEPSDINLRDVGNGTELPVDQPDLIDHSTQPVDDVQLHPPSNQLPTPNPEYEVSEKQSDEKLMKLSEKTEVYEQQLLNLSQRNAHLNEENDNLRTEIARLKDNLEKEVRKEAEEAMKALKLQENSNKVLEEEKTNLLKQITVLKSQLASRMTNEQVQNAIAEKEESIKGLMEEGEVLAKKHLQQNNLIKKLKSQSQDKETELKSLREKASKFEDENSRLKDELKLAKGQGQEERETSLRISDAYEQRERETQILQEKLSQSEEKQRTLQVNLDAAYKEIGDLHKQIAEQESRTLAEWKEKESEVRRESALEKKKIMSEQEHQKQLLMLQIMELNNSVSRVEASASRKDDDHRREIKELQQRLQESEGRNQDLSDNVSSATRPLLRQIENLQATHSTQQRSWNALEKTLNSRLGEAQAELLGARESERIAQSTAIEAKSKATAFEKHIENNKKIIARQENQIESLGKQIDEYLSQIKSVTEELEDVKTAHKEMIHKSRKERLFLENQLQMEKVRSEADRKKHAAQQEVFQREKDRLMWNRSEITSVSSNQILETESVGSSNDTFHQTDGLEKHLSSSSLPGLASQLSFEGGRGMSVSNVLENLQTQLKLREGEIAQLRGEINMLEKTRSSMAEEIVRLTNLNEDLEGVSGEFRDVKEKLSEVENRYAAILTMYGEKQEENEELKMDLADVKAMYRQQINDLLKGETSS